MYICILIFISDGCVSCRGSTATACCFRSSAGNAFIGEEELVSYGGSLDDILCVEVL